MEVCPRLLCPNHCNGNGVCDDTSTCRCHPGWSGSDCSRKECASSADCTSTQTCNRNLGYCVDAPPPPAPPPVAPPPPSAATRTYKVSGRGVIGPLKGCAVLLDADGDGRLQDAAYDPLIREVTVISDTNGAFELEYSGTFVRPGVLPRNNSLISMPGQPQVLVQPSTNCRDQYSGSLLWGSLRSLYIREIFPELQPVPIDDMNIITSKTPSVFSVGVVDPFTTLIGEVYLLLVKGYREAGLIPSLSRDQIFAEASYRTAIALDTLTMDGDFMLDQMNSSVTYRYVAFAPSAFLLYT